MSKKNFVAKNSSKLAKNGQKSNQAKQPVIDRLVDDASESQLAAALDEDKALPEAAQQPVELAEEAQKQAQDKELAEIEANEQASDKVLSSVEPIDRGGESLLIEAATEERKDKAAAKTNDKDDGGMGDMFPLLAGLAGLAALAGGGGGGGNGPTNPLPPGFQGIVFDTPVTNAIVFRDSNGNGKWDAKEAIAVTDSNGNYSGLTGSGNIIATSLDRLVGWDGTKSVYYNKPGDSIVINGKTMTVNTQSGYAIDVGADARLNTADDFVWSGTYVIGAGLQGDGSAKVYITAVSSLVTAYLSEKGVTAPTQDQLNSAIAELKTLFVFDGNSGVKNAGTNVQFLTGELNGQVTKIMGDAIARAETANTSVQDAITNAVTALAKAAKLATSGDPIDLTSAADLQAIIFPTAANASDDVKDMAMIRAEALALQTSTTGPAVYSVWFDENGTHVERVSDELSTHGYDAKTAVGEFGADARPVGNITVLANEDKADVALDVAAVDADESGVNFQAARLLSHAAGDGSTSTMDVVDGLGEVTSVNVKATGGIDHANEEQSIDLLQLQGETFVSGDVINLILNDADSTVLSYTLTSTDLTYSQTLVNNAVTAFRSQIAEDELGIKLDVVNGQLLIVWEDEADHDLVELGIFGGETFTAVEDIKGGTPIYTSADLDLSLNGKITDGIEVLASNTSTDATAHIEGNLSVAGSMSVTASGTNSYAEATVNGGDTGATVLGSVNAGDDLTVTASGDNAEANATLNHASGRMDQVAVNSTGDDSYACADVTVEADKTLTIQSVTLVANSAQVDGSGADADAYFRGETGQLGDQRSWETLNDVATDHGKVVIAGDISVTAVGTGDWAYLGVNEEENDNGYTVLGGGDIQIIAQGENASADVVMRNVDGAAGSIDVVATGTSAVQGFNFLSFFDPDPRNGEKRLAAGNVIKLSVGDDFVQYTVTAPEVRNALSINALLESIVVSFNQQAVNKDLGISFSSTNTGPYSNADKGLFVTWDSIRHEEPATIELTQGVTTTDITDFNTTPAYEDYFVYKDGTVNSDAYLELNTEYTGVTAQSLTVNADAQDSTAASDISGDVTIRGDITVTAAELNAEAYADINGEGNGLTAIGGVNASALEVHATVDGADASLVIGNASGSATSVDVRATADETSAYLSLQALEEDGNTLSIAGAMNVVANGVDASADAIISTTSAALQEINVTADDVNASADLNIVATGNVSASSLNVTATGEDTDAAFRIDAASVAIRGDLDVKASGDSAYAYGIVDDATVLGHEGTGSNLDVQANGEYADARLFIENASGKISGVNLSATGDDSFATVDIDDNDGPGAAPLNIIGAVTVNTQGTDADAYAYLAGASAQLNEMYVTATGISADAHLSLSIEEELSATSLTVAADGESSDATATISGAVSISGHISVTATGVDSNAGATISGSTKLTGNDDIDITVTALNPSSSAELDIQNASGSVDAVEVSARYGEANVELNVSVEESQTLSINSVSLGAGSFTEGDADANVYLRAEDPNATVEIQGAILVSATGLRDSAYLGVNDNIDNGQTILRGGDIAIGSIGNYAVAHANIDNVSGDLVNINLNTHNYSNDALLDLNVSGNLTVAENLILHADGVDSLTRANIVGDVSIEGNVTVAARTEDATATAQINADGNGTTTFGQTISGDVVGSAIEVTASGITSTASVGIKNVLGTVDTLTVTASGAPNLDDRAGAMVNVDGDFVIQSNITFTASGAESFVMAGVNMYDSLDPTSVELQGGNISTTASGTESGVISVVMNANGQAGNVDITASGESSDAILYVSTDADALEIINVNVLSSGEEAQALGQVSGDVHITGDISVIASELLAQASNGINAPVEFSPFSFSPVSIETQLGDANGGSNITVEASGVYSSADSNMGSVFGFADAIEVTANNNSADANLDIVTMGEGLTVNTLTVTASSLDAVADADIDGVMRFTGDTNVLASGTSANSSAHLTGSVDVTADIFVDATALNAAATYTVEGVFTMSGDISADASGQCADVTVDLSDAVTVSGDINITASGFNADAVTHVNGTVDLTGDLTVTASCEDSEGRAYISGDIKVVGDINANASGEYAYTYVELSGSMDVTGDINATASVDGYSEVNTTIDGTLVMSGDVNVTAASEDDYATVQMSSHITLTGDINVNASGVDSNAYSEMYVDVNITGDVNATASAYIAEAYVRMEGDVDFTGNMSFDANAELAKTLVDINDGLANATSVLDVGTLRLESSGEDSQTQVSIDNASGTIDLVTVNATGDSSESYLEVAVAVEGEVPSDSNLTIETINVRANSDMSATGDSSTADAYLFGKTGDIPEQERWKELDSASTDHGTVQINGNITVTAAGYNDSAYLGVNDSGPDGVTSDDGYTVVNGGNVTLAATGTNSDVETYIHNANGTLTDVSVTAGGNSEVQGFDFLHYFRPSGGKDLQANDVFSFTVDGHTLSYKVKVGEFENTTKINALLETVVASFNEQAEKLHLGLQFTSSYIETDRETSRLVPFEKGLFATWDSIRNEDAAVIALDTAATPLVGAVTILGSDVDVNGKSYFHTNNGNEISTAYFELKTENGGVTIETLTVIASAKLSDSAASITGDVAITGDITVSATEVDADASADIGGDMTDTVLGHMSNDVPVGSNITVEATNTRSDAQASIDHVSGHVADLSVQATGDDSSADLFMEIEADKTLTLETMTVNANSTASGGSSAEANAYLRGEKGTIADQDRWSELNDDSTDHGTVAIEGEITVTAGGTDDWAYLGVNDTGPDSNNDDRGYTLLGKNGTGSDLTVQATGTDASAEAYIYNATGTVAEITVEASGSHEVQGFDLLYFFRPNEGEIRLRAGEQITYTVGENAALVYTVDVDDARNVVGINAMLEKIVVAFNEQGAGLGVTFKSTHLDPLSPFEKGLFATWDTIRDEEAGVIRYVASGGTTIVNNEDYEFDYFYTQDGTVRSDAYLDLRTENNGVTADSLTVTASAEDSIADTFISGSVDILGDITVSASELSADAYAYINGEDEGNTTLGQEIEGLTVGSAISVTASDTTTVAATIIHNVLGTVDTLTVTASGGSVNGGDEFFDRTFACADVAGDFVIQSDITVTASGTDSWAMAGINCADTDTSATMEGGNITVLASGDESLAFSMINNVNGLAGDVDVTASGESADSMLWISTDAEMLAMNNVSVLSSAEQTQAAALMSGDIHITGDISVEASGLSALASTDINGNGDFFFMPFSAGPVIDTHLGDTNGGSNISVISSGQAAKAAAAIGSGTGTAGNVTVHATGAYVTDVNDEIINSEADLDMHLDGTIEGNLDVAATNVETSADAVINGEVTMEGDISVTASGMSADAVADINRDGSETTTLAVGEITVTASAEDAFADLNIDNAKGSTGHIALAATSEDAEAYVDVWVADNQNVTIASMSLDASGYDALTDLTVNGLSDTSTVTVMGDIAVSATGYVSDAGVYLMDNDDRQGRVVLGGGDMVLNNLADAAETRVHIFNASGSIGEINLLNTGADTDNDDSYAHVELEAGSGQNLTIESMSLLNQSGDGSVVNVVMWTGSGDSDIFITGDISVTAQGANTDARIEFNEESTSDSDANRDTMNTGTITLGKTVNGQTVGSNISVLANGDESDADAYMYNLAGSAGNIHVEASGDRVESGFYPEFQRVDPNNLIAKFEENGASIDEGYVIVLDGVEYEVEAGTQATRDARLNAALPAGVTATFMPWQIQIIFSDAQDHAPAAFKFQDADNAWVTVGLYDIDTDPNVPREVPVFTYSNAAEAYTEMELDGTVEGDILVKASGLGGDADMEAGGSITVKGDVEVLASGQDSYAVLDFNDDDEDTDADDNIDFNDDAITTMAGGNYRVAATGTSAYAESELMNAMGNVGALSVEATGESSEADFEARIEADKTLTIDSVTVLANSYGQDMAYSEAYLSGDTGVDAAQTPWEYLEEDDIDHGTVAITGNITVSALGAQDEAYLQVNTQMGEDGYGDYVWQKDDGYTVLGGGNISVTAAGTHSWADGRIANARGTVGDITVNAQGAAEVQGFDFLYFFRPAGGEMSIGRDQVFTYTVAGEVFTYNITTSDFPLNDTVPRAIRINTLLNSIVDSFNEQAEEKGLDVSFSSYYDGPTFDNGLFITWENRQDNALVEIRLNDTLIAESVEGQNEELIYKDYFFTQDGTEYNDAYLELQNEIRGVSADSLTVTATAESGEAHAEILGNVTILGDITVNASELYAEAKAHVNADPTQNVTSVNLFAALMTLVIEIDNSESFDPSTDAFELIINGQAYNLNLNENYAGPDELIADLNQQFESSGITFLYSAGLNSMEDMISINWPIGQEHGTFQVRAAGITIGMEEILALQEGIPEAPALYLEEEVVGEGAELIGDTVLGGGDITVTSTGSVSYEEAVVSLDTDHVSFAEAVVNNATGSIGSILVSSSGAPLTRDVEGALGAVTEVQTIDFDKFATWAGSNDDNTTDWTLRVDGGVAGSEDDTVFTFSGDDSWDDLEAKYASYFEENNSYDFFLDINDSGDLVITWDSGDVYDYDLAVMHGEGTITRGKDWVTQELLNEWEGQAFEVSEMNSRFSGPSDDFLVGGEDTIWTISINGEDFSTTLHWNGDSTFATIVEGWADAAAAGGSYDFYYDDNGTTTTSDDWFTVSILDNDDTEAADINVTFAWDASTDGSITDYVGRKSQMFDVQDVDDIIAAVDGETMDSSTTWTLNVGGSSYSVSIDVDDNSNIRNVLFDVVASWDACVDTAGFDLRWDSCEDWFEVIWADSADASLVTINVTGSDGNTAKEIDIGVLAEFTSQDGVQTGNNWSTPGNQEVQKFYFDKFSSWSSYDTSNSADETITSVEEDWKIIVYNGSVSPYANSKDAQFTMSSNDLINLLSEDSKVDLLEAWQAASNAGNFDMTISIDQQGGYFTVIMGDYNGWNDSQDQAYYVDHAPTRFETERVITREATWSEDNLSLDTDFEMTDGFSSRTYCEHEYIPSISVLDLEFSGAISGDVTVESTNVAAESYATIHGEMSISGDITLRATGDESIAELLINQNDNSLDIGFSNDIAVSVTGDEAEATLVLNGLVGEVKTLTVDVTGQDAVANVDLVFNDFGSVKATSINVAHRGEALVTLDQSMQNALVQDTGPVGLTPFNTGTVSASGEGHVGLTYLVDSSTVTAKTIDLRSLNQTLVNGEVTQKTWGYADIDLVAKWENGDAQGPQFTSITTLFPKIMEIKGFNVDRDVINLSHVVDPAMPLPQEAVVSDYYYVDSSDVNDHYYVGGDDTLIVDLETSGVYFEAVQDLLADATLYFRDNFDNSDIKSLGYFYREIEFEFGRGNSLVTETRSFLVYDFDLNNSAASGIITFGSTTGLTERNVTERYALIQEDDSSDTVNTFEGYNNIDLFHAASVLDGDNSASYDLGEDADVMINDIVVTAYETMESDRITFVTSGDVSMDISGDDDSSLQLRQSEILVAADRENSEALLSVSDAWGTVSSLKLHGYLGGVVSASISNIDYMGIEEYAAATSSDEDDLTYEGHWDNGLYIRDVEVIADGNLSIATLSLDVDGFIDTMKFETLGFGSSIDAVIDQAEYGGEVFISGSNLTEEHASCDCIDEVGDNVVNLNYVNGTAAKIVIDNSGREPLAGADIEDDESISFNLIYSGEEFDKDLNQFEAWDQMVTIEGWTQNDTINFKNESGDANDYQHYAGQLLDFDEQGKNTLLRNAFDALEEVDYYFGQMGGNGYLFYDEDSDGLTMIVEFLGVTTFDYTKIVGGSNGPI